MNKQELIDAIAEDADVSKAVAARVLDAFTGNVQNALREDQSVTLVGFGTFSRSDRPARTGRNPQTGETLYIDASSTAKFKPGKALKDALN